MKTPRIMIMMVALLSLTVSSSALAGKIENEPGYLDLEWIEIPDDASEVQDIDLTAILKSVAKDAEDNGDSELAQILTLIRSIRVKGFGLDGRDNPAVEKAVERVTKELKKQDWKRLIYLKDDDEILSVSTKYKNDDLVGLMVMAYEPGEEVLFANIVGDLDLGTIMGLVGSMDGGGLEDLLDELEDVEIEVNRN
jgi:hypothetical protein|nr:DUF4252 domain-containing protein [Candidatus Krumholzibacteria bacterium]